MTDARRPRPARPADIMDLSTDQFIQILTHRNAGPADGETRDQRRQPRVGVRARAMIIPLSEGSHPTPLAVQVRDLSPSGIGFLHVQKMALDEQFALVLPRADDTPAVILCTVAFWQPLAGELYAIGARFTRILRDGGEPPLPIEVEPAKPADLAAEIQQLHRKAG